MGILKLCLLAMTTWMVVACGSIVGEVASTSAPEHSQQIMDVPSGQVSLYFFRKANYIGEGRIHLLQIDQRTLGPLTDANYYHLMLWPGHYHLNVHLPPENFLGQTKPAMNKSRSLVFEPRHAGRTFFWIYQDGSGFQHVDAKPHAVKALAAQRTLAMALKAEETAHVDRFLDTRYEGPSLFGKPHGKGTLLWEDGCRYEGVFKHGQLADEGKFFFPDGRIYMGQLHKGRPKGRGVLISVQGRVLYAGPFADEVPHGRGIRQGPGGPEYCTYHHGVDTTISIRQLAEEALDAEENAVKDLIQATSSSSLETAEPTGSEEGLEEAETLDPNQKLDRLLRTRDWRTIVMRKTITAENAEALEQERSWCQDELAQKRDWCICAPFDPQAGDWLSCKR
jgi:hypothetical protein